jgi:hypothetical protein
MGKIPEGENLRPGEPWVVEPGTSVYTVCCGCKLVHRIRFTMKGKKIVMRWYLDEDETKTRRRKDPKK